MKKAMAYLIIIFILVGCSSDRNVVESGALNNLEESKIEQPSYNPDKYRNNPQAPATDSLTEIGQVFTDENGEVELKAITDAQTSTTIGAIDLTISDIKMLNYTPANHLIDFFHGFTHHETNFNYL